LCLAPSLSEKQCPASVDTSGNLPLGVLIALRATAGCGVNQRQKLRLTWFKAQPKLGGLTPIFDELNQAYPPFQQVNHLTAQGQKMANTLIAQDNFTGNGTSNPQSLGPNWFDQVTGGGSLKIHNNVYFTGVYQTQSGYLAATAFWNGSFTQALSPDQMSEIKLVDPKIWTSSNSRVGVTVRASGFGASRTFYELVVMADAAADQATELNRWVGGLRINMKSSRVAWASGDLLQLCCIGNQLTVMKNGVAIPALSMLDNIAPISNGKPGIVAAWNMMGDDWKAYNIGSTVNSKYRSLQRYLFQSIPSKFIAARLVGGIDYPWEIFGPTYYYVDSASGWEWGQAGGDWIDANQTPYGAVPWFAIASDKASGASAVASYTGDVTNLLKYVQTADRWCALLLKDVNAPRTIAGLFNTSNPAPFIDVSYTNGSTARLACRIVAINGISASQPSTTNSENQLPIFIEFERPTSAVASAQISYVLTQHWSGANPRIEGYLLNPPVNRDSPVAGLAAAAGRLDAGIESQTPVIGAHRYIDGALLSNFTYSGASNFMDESNYDPAIFNNGAQDLSKFPHVGLGKWVNASPVWSLVNSSYTADNFKPLTSGLGALRIPMNKEVMNNGDIVGYDGTLAGNGMIFLPESMFGRLDRIFVRYYFRLAGPYKPKAVDRLHVYNEPGTAVWTTMAGKFGIAPDHNTTDGGVSGTSGGGYGWQMRSSWYDCDTNLNGPDEGGWAVGYHLYDFLNYNPPGYNYGKDKLPPFERWGQLGGTGGVFYADQWYCVETELKLNSVFNSGTGFTPDGALRTWVDGRLVYQRTGMVFRTLPLISQPFVPNKIRPCRELGVRGLWLDWFHGGRTKSSLARVSFYTGLVWSRQYIGPMNV
jgi:hypothetical protein